MRKRIAVIGSGISGLTCAYLLSKNHDVTVFEANDYLGGHTATIDVEVAGKKYAIDTGFIVFNDRTYPNFQQLLSHLDIIPCPTQMSFSVHNKQSGLEYNGHTVSSLFAQKRNIINPKFWRFLAEILRFNRCCKSCYDKNQYSQTNLGEFLLQQGFSSFFARHYVLPMGAAIWSASLDDMLLFPLKFFICFFHHHGLLNISDRPQWFVLAGGSRTYIPKLTEPYKNNIRLNCPVTRVIRSNQQVIINTEQYGEDIFDEVIMACHSDQALALLGDASAAEKAILSHLPYQENEVVLHTDTSLLPKRKSAWASWNYRLDSESQAPASVTYNMNILQGLPKYAPTFCVTLNQTSAIEPNKILARFKYSHPMFSEAGVLAQQRKDEICGKRHTYFAGAYWQNGFHEDGVNSALSVCQKFGIDLDALPKLANLLGSKQLA